MAYQETHRRDIEAAQLRQLAGNRLAAVGRALAGAVRRVQYGQMVAVLNRLSDENLARIGVRRQDIPRHARRLIYETG